MNKVHWFKRDIRLRDNEALKYCSDARKSYAIYIFNPEQLSWPDVDLRHWVFAFQSLNDLRNQGFLINTFFGKPEDVLNSIYSEIGDFELTSHEETGTDASWGVDKRVSTWIKDRQLSWKEFNFIHC